jgi:hypothetical protein
MGGSLGFLFRRDARAGHVRRLSFVEGKTNANGAM